MDMKKAVVHRGDTSRLAAVMAKAARGGEICVGFLGGSITQGSLASELSRCYASLVADWWRQSFPTAAIRDVNAGIGGTTGGEEDIPVADPGELLDTLDALCADIVEGSYCAAPRSSSDFNNYFNGSVQYTEGLRVAMNHLQMAPPAHIVMLIEVPEGEDAEAFAKNLADNANPRWMVCAVAESVQYAVKGDLVLFVMSSEDVANAVIAAFNG